MPGISELQVTPLQTANGRPGAMLLEFAALADVPVRQQRELANRLRITRTIALRNRHDT